MSGFITFSKKAAITLCSVGLSLSSVNAQDFELVEIHGNQQFYLNNATRDAIGTGDNEVYLKVDLPPLTKEWYYSFNAIQAKRGASLGLIGQLTNAFDKTGIASLAIESITVPEGDARCDVYLTDHVNAMAFERDEAFQYWTSGTRENYSQGVAKITDVTQGSVYLCFSNPNTWDGVTISVEVVALVADKTEEEQAVEDVVTGVIDLIGAISDHKADKEENKRKEQEWRNTWQTAQLLFDAGQTKEADTYTRKALNMGLHPGLYFDLGLIQWVMDSGSTSTASYLSGLNMIYELQTKEEAIETLASAIGRIDRAMEQFPDRKVPEVANKLLTSKLEEVGNISSWKQR